jgi:hypothetical protein
MDPVSKLDELASRAYQAYCESAAPFLPTFYVPDWSLLPEVMKNAWRAAAKAIVSK